MLEKIEMNRVTLTLSALLLYHQPITMTNLCAEIWATVESLHTVLLLGYFPFWILEAFRSLSTSLPPEDGVHAIELSFKLITIVLSNYELPLAICQRPT